MADKYLRRDATSGLVAETQGTVTSTGAPNAGNIPALDTSGRLDTSLMPVGIAADTYTGPASGALSAGDLVYVKSDSTIARASAAASGVEASGFVLASSTSGASATIFFYGRNTSLVGLTPGARYYLSDATPGGITSTPVNGSGKLHQMVGYAVTPTTLDFQPNDAIYLA